MGKASSRRKTPATPWFVYMLECEGGRIYTGVTPDVAARLAKHRTGRGAAFTRINKPLRLLAHKRCGSRSAALKTEYRLKQLPRPEKLVWVERWARGGRRAKA